MIAIPPKLNLANLPTKIEKLERWSAKHNGPDIYIKRDDQTGTEISGNKIRKLEYAFKEALIQGCDYVITCGGIQSNHCRATAAVAAKIGLRAHLVLRGERKVPFDGNVLLDELFGATIRYITPQDYRQSRTEIMERVKKELDSKGFKSYIIPEGASNGIGSFGYFRAMEEIIRQEKEMGIHFDSIILAVGSGGTYAGLSLANKMLGNDCVIYGVNVCDDAAYFKNRIFEIVRQSLTYLQEGTEYAMDDINIIDGYVGEGYAIPSDEHMNCIADLARTEGIVLDPVYTGKAMYGLISEMKKGRFNKTKNVLFLHTGGLYGLFPLKERFAFQQT